MTSPEAVKAISDEVSHSRTQADYDAVDTLWVSLVRAANELQGKNEHERMVSLVGSFALNSLRKLLMSQPVTALLDLDPPLETVLVNRHEGLAAEETAKSLNKVGELRETDSKAALLELGDVLKRIRNKRAHGFKSRKGPRDQEILSAARSILDALCVLALESRAASNEVNTKKDTH